MEPSPLSREDSFQVPREERGRVFSPAFVRHVSTPRLTQKKHPHTPIDHLLGIPKHRRDKPNTPKYESKDMPAIKVGRSGEDLEADLQNQLMTLQLCVNRFLESRDDVTNRIEAQQLRLMKLFETYRDDGHTAMKKQQEPQEPHVINKEIEDSTSKAYQTYMSSEREEQLRTSLSVDGVHKSVSNDAPWMRSSKADASQSLALSGRASSRLSKNSKIYQAMSLLVYFSQSDFQLYPLLRHYQTALARMPFQESISMATSFSFGALLSLAKLLTIHCDVVLLDVVEMVNNVNRFELSIAVALVDWLISAVVCAFGLLMAWVMSRLDWSEDFDTLYRYVLVGSIFTSWNIAQYASYAIQTTGHLRLVEHARALYNAGGFLLLCNLLGWALTSVAHLISDTHLQRAAVAMVPCICAGIWMKMYCKLRYLKKYELACVSSDPKVATEDAVWRRLQRDLSGTAQSCPFKSLTTWVCFRYSAGPATCFVYTLFYTIGLRVLYNVANSLEDGTEKMILRIFIFIVSGLCFFIGDVLLNKWIDNSRGLMAYSSKMCAAFFFIYGVISELQIRVGLVQFEGVARTILSILLPVAICLLRYKHLNKFKGAVMQLQRTNAQWMVVIEKGVEKGSAEYDEAASEFMRLSALVNKLVVFTMSSMITQNVSGCLLTGMTCIFKDNSRLSFGSCEDGFWLQIFWDNFPTWIADFITVSNLTNTGLPLFYYFTLLDPFMVVAVLLVTYMGVCLVLFTAAITWGL